MTELVWKRDCHLDSEMAVTEFGTYLMVRTFLDTSKLYFNKELIGTSNVGSHEENRKRAEAHFSNLKSAKDDTVR